jgi:hypothetical protein
MKRVLHRYSNTRLRILTAAHLSQLLPATLTIALSGCTPTARFPVQDPMRVDDDRRRIAKAPAEYVSPFIWDGADQMVFRPIARVFAFDPAGRAANVTALDEVANSSWFENRVSRMNASNIQSGPCGTKVLDPNASDGAWTIDQGKPNGANPGFRVNVPGVGKFMLKVDPDGEPERATGATAIAARLYYAAGFSAPCDSVVYFRPSILRLKPGLQVTDNSGIARAFDEQALEQVLRGASKRNGLLRMVASRWLPGKPIGPFRYEGTRADDPNDVVPHEDRRELRGGRLLAAWLNHFDTREQNTMDVFLPDDPKQEGSPGHVEHYILDLGDCFGSVWAQDQISRRLGYSYYFDAEHILRDFVTIGIPTRPWDRTEKPGGIFNYFRADDFDPAEWRGGYGNPAFLRMTEGDAAWMTRILARISPAMVDAAVDTGQYDSKSSAYLKDALKERQVRILRRYLRVLSPLSEVEVLGRTLCATDLAKLRSVDGVAEGHYRAAGLFYSGDSLSAQRWLGMRQMGDARVCVTLPSVVAEDSPLIDDDPERYVIFDMVTSSSANPLRAHLVDLGTRGYKLVGVERPIKPRRPR